MYVVLIFVKVGHSDLILVCDTLEWKDAYSDEV